MAWLPPWLPKTACAQSPFLLSLQLSALIPGLLKGREFPDAAVVQQWLNVFISAPFWGIVQAAADAAAAMFVNYTGFTVFRDK